jgi:hypothetical protein
MKTFRKTWILSVLIVLLAVPAAAYYDHNKPSQGGTTDHFYLGFSIGEGTYINYKCGDAYECDAVLIAPLDFELLLGYKIAPNFYLDFAVNWSVDVYEGYYQDVAYYVGFTPGVRLVLPGLFHRHLYFRAGVPIMNSLHEDDDIEWIIGVLLGVGLEWRFANMGFFVEADFTPYFVEVYPGYYVIPVEGRAGISVRF